MNDTREYKMISTKPLILGIKVGHHDWYDKLIKSNLSIPACEVYFNISHFPSYKELFSFLQKRQIKVGLHFSSLLPNRIDPNFATKNEIILQKSIDLLKETIDIATRYRFDYVVYHPGSSRVWGTDKNRKYFLTDIVTNKEKSNKIFLKTAIALHNYAKKNKLQLYIETLPRKLLSFEFAEIAGRIDTLDVNFIPFNTILQAGKNGCVICNDICHTMAGINSSNPDFLQIELLRRTQLLLPYTGVVHLVTTKPPFNGTDDNGSFLDEDYAQEAIPTKENMERLFRMLCQKDKLILIPEPMLNSDIHIKNYLVLLKLISESSRARV